MADAAKSTNDAPDVRAEYDALRRDISNLSDAVSRLLGETVDEARAKTREHAKETVAAARQAADSTGTSVSNFVDERPGTSLLIAFGAGLVFGTFLRRS